MCMSSFFSYTHSCHSHNSFKNILWFELFNMDVWEFRVKKCPAISPARQFLHSLEVVGVANLVVIYQWIHY